MVFDKELILNRIKEAYNFKNSAELADFLGIARNTLTNWYKRNSIDYDLVFSKCEHLNIDWLITGKGQMLRGEYINSPNTSYVSENSPAVYKLKTDTVIETQRIPLFDIQASAGLTSLFDTPSNQIPIDFISIPNAPKCDGATYVRGDSMYPILKAGDIVCYKMVADIRNIFWGEMYLLDIDVEGDQFLTYKYIQKSTLGDEYVRLVSQNQHHDPKDELKSNIKKLALVKVSIRYNTLS